MDAIAPKLDRQTARERANVIKWWVRFRVEHDQPVDVGTLQDIADFFEWRDQQPVRIWAYYTDKQYSVVVRSWLRWWGGLDV